MSLNQKDSGLIPEKSQKESTSISTNDLENMLDILEEYSIEINSNLEILHKNLLFLKHGFNLVIGESKSGKTFTTIKSLVDVGFKDQIIHIDFDRNTDLKLDELGVKTYHINNPKELFKKLNHINKFEPLKDAIIVIDSLQDLGLDDGIDTNSAALNAMNRVAIFGDTEATLIVIHHTTLQEDGTPKVKGNATTISSKADNTLLFTRNKDIRTTKVLNTRAEDKIRTGSIITYEKEEHYYKIPK